MRFFERFRHPAVFAQRVLTEPEIQRARIRAGFFVVGSGLAAGLALWFGVSLGDEVSLLVNALATVVGVFAAAGAACCVEHPDGYAWLPSAKCGNLANLCDRYPGLAPYRDAVRITGRRFTLREYAQMVTWAKRQRTLEAKQAAARRLQRRIRRERAGCQRLYGFPSEGA